jgi:drug/metabolite transporter (DMT)-like permease
MSEIRENKFFGDLFPSQWSAIIFIFYMILFINQGILVKASQTSDNKYNYSIVAVVLLTECLKLIISISIYAKDKPIKSLIPDIVNNQKVFILYFVPAFLYCLYNNLSFINLAAFGPTTYYLLLELRVVVTGIIYQILFNRKLSKIQWISLVLLTIGCVVKQIGDFTANSATTSLIGANLLFIFLQIFCSCFAGVYNEYLLKGVESEVHLMINNVFMYIDSIVSNLFLFLITGELSRLSELSESYKIFSDPKIIAVMVNNALIGIVVRLFLKNLNSILKIFTGALQLIFMAILCFFIFGTEIDIYTLIAIAVVSYATYLYSQNPVVTTIKLIKEEENFENSDLEYVLVKNSDENEIETI